MSNKKWNVVHHNGQCYVTEGDHHIIARVDDLAHADLLAAAPELKAQRDDLLTALKAMLSIDNWLDEMIAPASVIAKARAAIANAEGAK